MTGDKYRIEPPESKWPKQCLCKQPFNPDILQVGCSGCDDWFHPKCCGVNPDENDENEDWFCPTCVKRKNNEENSNFDNEITPKVKNDYINNKEGRVTRNSSVK